MGAFVVYDTEASLAQHLAERHMERPASALHSCSVSMVRVLPSSPCRPFSPREGTSISIFGTLPASNSGSTTTYALDASTPVNINTPASDTTTYGHMFYNSPNLDAREHTIIVTASNVSDPTPFWFDYLEYTPISSDNSSGSANLPSSGMANSAGVHPSAGSSLSPASFTPFPTASIKPVSAASNGTASDVGTIVAAVVVPVGVVVVGLLGFLYWRRRRLALTRYKANVYRKEGILEDGAPDGRSSFLRASTHADLGPAQTSVAHLTAPVTSPSDEFAHPSPAPARGKGRAGLNLDLASHTDVGTTSYTSPRNASESGPSSSVTAVSEVSPVSSGQRLVQDGKTVAMIWEAARRPAVFHVDGGVRLEAGAAAGAGDAVEDVPPSYRPY